MTYDQAYAATQCGGRIRRANWQDDERFVRFEGCLMDEMGFQWMPRPSDVMAHDWEMFK